MRTPILLGLAVALAGLPVEGLRAQAAADSLQLASVLAEQLRAEEGADRYELRDSVSAFEQHLLNALASASRGAVGRPLPCPWGWDQSAAPFGYRITVRYLKVERDTAVAYVDMRCDNPPGYLHDVFGKSLEFIFARGSGEWVFVDARLMRITEE